MVSIRPLNESNIQQEWFCKVLQRSHSLQKSLNLSRHLFSPFCEAEVRTRSSAYRRWDRGASKSFTKMIYPITVNGFLNRDMKTNSIKMRCKSCNYKYTISMQCFTYYVCLKQTIRLDFAKMPTKAIAFLCKMSHLQIGTSYSLRYVHFSQNTGFLFSGWYNIVLILNEI